MSFLARKQPDNSLELDFASTMDATGPAEWRDPSLELLEAYTMREMDATWRDGR